MVARTGPTPSYHVTQDLTQTQLDLFETAAQRQEDFVVKLFMRKRRPLSAEEIKQEFPPSVPITSIRRALTNLSNAGVVEKCGQDKGQYGRPINIYQLRRATP